MQIYTFLKQISLHTLIFHAWVYKRMFLMGRRYTDVSHMYHFQDDPVYFTLTWSENSSMSFTFPELGSSVARHSCVPQDQTLIVPSVKRVCIRHQQSFMLKRRYYSAYNLHLFINLCARTEQIITVHSELNRLTIQMNYQLT